MVGFPIPFIFILGARVIFLSCLWRSVVRILDVYGHQRKQITSWLQTNDLSVALSPYFLSRLCGGRWNRMPIAQKFRECILIIVAFWPADVCHIKSWAQRDCDHARTFFEQYDGGGWVTKGGELLEAPCFFIWVLISLLFYFPIFFAICKVRGGNGSGAFLAFFYGWVLIIFSLNVIPSMVCGQLLQGALSLFIPFSFLFVGLLGFQEIQVKLNKLVPISVYLFWLTFIVVSIWCFQNVAIDPSLK
jgi:hypothetical protein